jgi:hypothetical protein
MSGVTAFGAYVPIFRLGRDAIAQAWGRGSLRGERSVANNDEDTATMAAEAAVDALRGVDRGSVDGVFWLFGISRGTESAVITAGWPISSPGRAAELVTCHFRGSQKQCITLEVKINTLKQVLCI